MVRPGLAIEYLKCKNRVTLIALQSSRRSTVAKRRVSSTGESREQISMRIINLSTQHVHMPGSQFSIDEMYPIRVN